MLRSPSRFFRCRAPSVVLLAAALLAHGTGATAQAPPSAGLAPGPAGGAPDGARPRLGLVLSGGSAKGFAHIGVLRVLHDLGLHPDVIAGTSMGAIVGGLHAAGVGVDSLRQLALELPWSDLIADVRDRREAPPDERFLGGRTLVTVPLEGSRPTLPQGAVEGANVQALLARLTWPWAAERDFGRLPVPFVALATDLESGEPVPLTGGVLADALRASMALPGAVSPVRIDGRLLVDGGLTRNLPAADAVALGADLLVCSDVSGPLAEAGELESMNAILMQVTAFRTMEFTREQRELCDVLIRPELDDLSSLAFDEAAAWMDRGEAAARSQRRALEELVRRLDAPGATSAAGAGESPPGAPPARRIPPSSPLPPAVVVRRVEVVGPARPEARRLVRERVERLAGPVGDLGLRVVDARVLDQVLRDLRATRLFEDVRYRLDREGDGVVLHLSARERRTDRLGLGVRYDEHYRASLLLEARLGGVAGYGSELLMSARLGEELQLEGSLVTGRGITTDVSLGGRLGWIRLPVDLYADGGVLARLEADVVALRALVGVTPDDATLVGLDVGGEWGRGSTAVAAQDTAAADLTGSVALVVLRDDRDDRGVPRRGGTLRLRLEAGISTVARGGRFQHHHLEAEHFVPLHRRVVARVGGYLGYADGADLPTQRNFFVGGVNTSQVLPDVHPTFYGASPQERLGTAVQIVRAGVRWEVLPARWIGVGVDAGGVGAGWRDAAQSWRVGWGLSVLAGTPVGPAHLAVHAGGGRSPAVVFSLGRRF